MLLNEGQRYQACNAVPLRSCTQSPMLAMRKSVVSSFGLSSSSRPAAMPRSSKHVCPSGSRCEVYRASLGMHMFPKGYLAILSAVPSEYYVWPYS